MIHFNGLRLRYWVAVKGDDLKLVPWECELNVLGGTRIQNVEQNTLAFLYPDGLAITQTFAVDR